MLPWWTYPACGCFLAGAVCGWPLGYVHREFVEWGQKAARLLAWSRAHRGSWRGWRRRNPYAELWADILHLCATGQLRPGRLAGGGAGTVTSLDTEFAPACLLPSGVQPGGRSGAARSLRHCQA